MTKRLPHLFLVVCCLMVSMMSVFADDRPLIFVSAFAAGDAGAIHACELDPETGVLRPVHRTGGVEHPFFLALSPDRRYLYSIHAPQKFGGTEPEFVAAWSLEGRTGRMSSLNRVSTHGTASCYLDVDRTGKTVLVANYMTGSVAALPVKADGQLGEAASFITQSGSSINAARQTSPHAHCMVVSPDNRHAYVADLGLDRILIWDLDAATAKLTPAAQPFVRTIPGAGPRHLILDDSGRRMYVINELSNSITRFQRDPASGMLIEGQTISTLPDDFQGTSHCADLKLTPDGRFLYGTNRGHDSIAAYRVGDDGQLALLEIVPSLGQGPQNLLVTKDGRWLLCANMPGNNVAVFRIDGQSGRLQSAGTPWETTSPSCLRLY